MTRITSTPSPTTVRRASSATTGLVRTLVVSASLMVGVGLSGCQTLQNEDGSITRTAKGGAIGALGGAAIGAATNGRKGALIGLGVGALSGGAIGNYMDRQQKTLEAELANSGVTVTREGDNLRLNMPGSLTFDTGSATVKPQFDAVLSDISNVLGEFEKTLVDVVGYTDSTGSDATNQSLSEQRARSVATYLSGNGVVAERLATGGRGASDPIASNTNAAGRERNRRVEIVLEPLTRS